MGIFRRSGSPPDDESVAALDGESGQPVDEEVPVGPTGRPLHPVGAYFEAAFRRFGINFTGYLLMTVVCALPTLFAVFIFRNTALSGEAAGALLSFAYALGFVTMTALATTLVAGGTRERLPPLVITCGVVGVLAGLIVVAVALWFGFTGLFFVVPASLRGDLILGFTSLFMWPISALVFRNLYGDMTGRLVINAAPNEDANRKAAMKKRREKSKRNRERIKKVTGEE